jgi:hypothetical protein
MGLGEFWSRPFIGSDVNFEHGARKPMIPVICSGDRLPFSDHSFDAVVASDVLEHVPPQSRTAVIAEALRVTRSVAVFGFPHGPAAFDLDKNLYSEYKKREEPPPVWLEEHMSYPFPTGELFRELPSGWKMKAIPNESLDFHIWVMRKEMHLRWYYIFRLALLIMPTFVERLLRKADSEPTYRMIFVLTRQQQAANS